MLEKSSVKVVRSAVSQPRRVAAGDTPAETVEFFNGDDMRVRCFLDKYALRDEEGYVVEFTPVQMWRRLARELALPEKPALRKEWEQNFYWLLDNFRFVPGGRIMFGAGQPRRATLLNCYVIPIQGDSIEGIFDWCKQAARTYSFGGGVGTDISVLRPRGAPVNNSAIHSTGSVSFMELFSTTTGTIGQAGRRGALMITISVEHPDVLDFINVKRDLSRVNHANISVRVTDAFMQAVAADGDFVLHYENEVVGRVEKKIKAKALWDKLIEGAWLSAEPGLIFWDNIKRESTTEYNGMQVVTTNPCSEIPLEPYGCCCLGNVNLARFVRQEFEVNAQVDWQNLERALRYAVRFLDNVLDYNAAKHPLKEQREASLKSRRIGVGFTGLGDMLVRLGLKYDTSPAVEFTDELFDRIKHIVHDESVELAREKGPFPAFEVKSHLKSSYLQRLDKAVLGKIKKYGLRNAALLTVPPVGSGSVLAGTSSGVEPIFALNYVRKSKSLSKKEFEVRHPLVEEYMVKKGLMAVKELPNLFVTAHQIDPEFRVRLQAVIQKHIDHAISSTVNLPKEITKEEVDRIYRLAWQLGCKGITVYREGSREGILLTEAEAKIQKGQALAVAPPRPSLSPRVRPAVVRGKTFKMKTEMGSVYVTINEDEQGLVETFVQLGKPGSSVITFTDALGRLISLALRSGIKPSEIVDQLKLIKGSRPVMQEDGQVVFSVPDAIAKAIERYLTGEQLNLFKADKSLPVAEIDYKALEQKKRHNDLCPSCGGILMFTNGCFYCVDCQYSKCE